MNTLYFSCDDNEWPWPCDINRAADVRLSDISGLMLDKSIFNDVYGTYLSYNVALAVPPGSESIYYSFYELLSAPVEGHAFKFPYNGGRVQMAGLVSDLRDTYIPMTDGSYWRGCTFTISSNHPTKYMSLDEVITRGRTPIPEQATYEDADERYY